MIRALLKPFSSLLIAALLAVSAAPAANARSGYSADEIEKLLIEFYATYGSESSAKWNSGALTGIDKSEVLHSVASRLSALKPASYNDVLGHLAIDYRHYPDHRRALEELFPILHAEIALELKANQEYSPVFSIIDKVFDTWGWMYVFGFGRGVWISRGKGLGYNPSFAALIENIRVSTPNWKVVLGTGVAIGAVDAIYMTLKDKRLDPERILDNEQQLIINALASEMATLRNDLRMVARAVEKGDDSAIERRAAELRQLLRDYRARIESINQQIGAFEEAAPQYRGIIDPIHAQIDESRIYYAKIGSALARIDDQKLSEEDPEDEEISPPPAKVAKPEKKHRVIP